MEEVYYVVFILLLMSIVVGFVGASRGRNGIIWFSLSMVISPLLAVVLVFLLPNRIRGEPPQHEDTPPPILMTHVHCPDCLELVPLEAQECTHCGGTLSPQQRAA